MAHNLCVISMHEYDDTHLLVCRAAFNINDDAAAGRQTQKSINIEINEKLFIITCTISFIHILTHSHTHT